MFHGSSRFLSLTDGSHTSKMGAFSKRKAKYNPNLKWSSQTHYSTQSAYRKAVVKQRENKMLQQEYYRNNPDKNPGRTDWHDYSKNLAREKKRVAALPPKEEAVKKEKVRPKVLFSRMNSRSSV